MQTPAAAIASLINRPVPHGVGLTVMPDGAVVKRSPGVPLNFTFTFSGLDFDAHVYDHDEKMHIRAMASPGSLPYSLESFDRRHEIIRVLSGIGPSVDPKLAWSGFGWHLGAQQRIHLGIGLDILPAAAPIAVLSELIFSLLPTRGWLQLIQRVCRPSATMSSHFIPDGVVALLPRTRMAASA